MSKLLWFVLLLPMCAGATSVPQFVFVKHAVMGGSHYAYTEAQSDAQHERHSSPGSALCLYDPATPGDHVATLLEDKTGVIRDPDVSWNAQQILFSWKQSLNEDDYHLYEMDVATRKVRQLTAGIGLADYEACYLPSGDIIFNSTRCVQTVDCWWTEVSNLYRCDKERHHRAAQTNSPVPAVAAAAMTASRLFHLVNASHHYCGLTRTAMATGKAGNLARTSWAMAIADHHVIPSFKIKRHPGRGNGGLV